MSCGALMCRLRSAARWLPAGILLVVCVAGCSEGNKIKGPKRATASGKVDLDGKAVPAGTVTFMEKASGIMAACPIKNGAYASENGQGPVPGDNLVSIQGTDQKGEQDLWSGKWSKEVKVEASGYKGDFSIKMSEVKPPVARTIDD